MIGCLASSAFANGYWLHTDRLGGYGWAEMFNSDSATYGGWDVGNAAGLCWPRMAALMPCCQLRVARLSTDVSLHDLNPKFVLAISESASIAGLFSVLTWPSKHAISIGVSPPSLARCVSRRLRHFQFPLLLGRHLQPWPRRGGRCRKRAAGDLLRHCRRFGIQHAHGACYLRCRMAASASCGPRFSQPWTRLFRLYFASMLLRYE